MNRLTGHVAAVLAALGACAAITVSASASVLSFPIVGSLFTPGDEFGIVGGGSWAHPPDGAGFIFAWEITDNGDDTFHYEYTFTDIDGNPLPMTPSHLILELSADIAPEDIFNFGESIGDVEFGEFGPGPSNPGFPDGESILGMKLNWLDDSGVASFDTTRLPQWSDGYVKGANDAFAYNRDLGVFMNPIDRQNFENPARDPDGNLLFKILAPDTLIPEPTAAALLGVGLLALMRRRR